VKNSLVFDHYPLPQDALPEGWALVSIEQIAKRVASGFPSGQHNQNAKGVPHIRPMNIDRDGRLDLSLLKYVEGEIPRELKKGDVLFNNTNSPELIGKTTAVLVDARLAYSNHMTRVRLEDGINPTFIARQLHFLWMCGYFRHRCVNHVNQASISAEPLSETVPILLPPAGEQERVADALDELLSDLDAGVAALERVRDKLKLYRAAVLKSAVEGALTAEWRKQHPQSEPASELLKRILAERRRRWEEEQLRKFKEKGREPPKNWKAKYKEAVAPDTTDLPPLPEGWCWGSWSQVGFSQNGRPFPSKQYQSSGIKLLRPGNLFADGTVKWTEKNTRCLPPHYGEDNADLMVRGRELVINLTAQSLKDDFLGRVSITAEQEECLLNQRLARLSPVIVSPEFMLIVFKSAQFRTFVAELNTGSLIQHMFTSQLDEFVFPLPPVREQQAIVEAVEDQLSVIDHLESDLDAKLTNAQALRQSILRDAFSGKLVPQDPNDEPASELLERIAAQREQRAREAGAAKRLNGHKQVRTSKPRGKGTRAKPTKKKEPEHGRIADR
jgi:type I restriction enzyme S subunit